MEYRHKCEKYDVIPIKFRSPLEAVQSINESYHTNISHIFNINTISTGQPLDLYN